MQNSNIPHINSTKKEDSTVLKPSIGLKNMQSIPLNNAPVVKKNKNNPQNIYCLGDFSFQLEYDISNDKWGAKKYNEPADQ